MARPTSAQRGTRSSRKRKHNQGGAINRESVRGTARGGNRKMKTPNARPTSSTRPSGSRRKRNENTPTRGLEPQRRSTRPNRQVFGTVDSAQRDESAPDQRDRARGWMGEAGERFAQGRGAPGRAQTHPRKSGANGGSRFEYDERDSTDSAEPTGWSGMDEERQKRPASRDHDGHDRDWSRTNTGRIDNDYEETPPKEHRRPSAGRRRARADTGDHAPPGDGRTADTEGHVTGAAARGRRRNGRMGATADRGRAGQPRNDW